MISMLDLCSGKWEREETGGDYEWEVVCTGWSPETSAKAREVPRLAPREGEARLGSVFPADLLDADLDQFLERMSHGG